MTATSRRRVAQLVELALFVLATEIGGAREQFVFDGDASGPRPSFASNARSSAYSQRAAAARSEAL